MEDLLRMKLTELYRETPCMPVMVRLAWHDAGTYCASSKTGGANGSIRFEPECSHGANNGLRWAIDQLEHIKAAVVDKATEGDETKEVSYADLYQLASVVAIEVSGGPKIPFRFGRKDVAEISCTEDGRLPDATKRMPHLRDVFYRMGFTDKDIVVLSGAHCLGRAHKDRSGFEGPWTQEPLVFDNSYFKEILKENPDPALLRLASDMALLDEADTKALVQAYAEDQDLFFSDYTIAHQKLSELGQFA
uniref:Plant heme peroxidase family profile domain-containing protein n=1 Tax=Compsopogon caeruleus TaxID=31354 RepID=A0A7S1T791_9RHOD|mmetsp:Transcript_12051/g.24537  ORF Transcript_12051/g.24537 Transcript_12051/m.24537 type:complete len:248 (+) Transcript_12051:118-861(+)